MWYVLFIRGGQAVLTFVAGELLANQEFSISGMCFFFLSHVLVCYCLLHM